MSRAALLTLALGGALAAGCSSTPSDPLRVENGRLTVDNRSDTAWTRVEVWINRYFRATASSIPAGSRVEVPLDAFVSGYGQRFNPRRMPIDDLRLTATDSRGHPVTLVLQPQPVGLAALGGKK
jgi:hypothetical protein